MSEPMQVLALGPQEGKTTTLLHWLLDGHVLDRWPSWSRVVGVSTAGRARQIVVENPGIDKALRALSHGRVGLPKVVLALDRDSYALNRGASMHDVEIALDDIDEFICRIIGRMPAVVTMTGTPMKAREQVP